jgi:hypothetical protein
VLWPSKLIWCWWWVRADSSNSNRLREVAASQNTPAYLVQDETELQASWLLGVSKIGITSGASTPEVLVKRVVDALSQNPSQQVIALPGVQEDVVFRLPLELSVNRVGAHGTRHPPRTSAHLWRCSRFTGGLHCFQKILGLDEIGARCIQP